jgi:hypothetical protein
MDEIAKLKAQVSYALAREYIYYSSPGISKGNGIRKCYLTERQRATLLEASS